MVEDIIKSRLICTTILHLAADVPIHTKTHLELWQVGQLGIVIAL